MLFFLFFILLIYLFIFLPFYVLILSSFSRCSPLSSLPAPIRPVSAFSVVIPFRSDPPGLPPQPS